MVSIISMENRFASAGQTVKFNSTSYTFTSIGDTWGSISDSCGWSRHASVRSVGVDGEWRRLSSHGRRIAVPRVSESGRRYGYTNGEYNSLPLEHFLQYHIKGCLGKYVWLDVGGLIYMSCGDTVRIYRVSRMGVAPNMISPTINKMDRSGLTHQAIELELNLEECQCLLDASQK